MAIKNKPTKKPKKPVAKKKIATKKKSNKKLINWDSATKDKKRVPAKAPQKRKNQSKQVKFDYTTAA